jgi:quercetin dioxygenase-like cupin family protein
MARVGDTIEHPLTGERLTFVETGGGVLKLRIEMVAGGSLPRPHVHPVAEERFEVTAGRIQMVTGGIIRIAEPGEAVVMPCGAAHVWGNPFDEPAAVDVALDPALDMETFFETWFGLANDGKLDLRTQLPSFLQMALLAHDFRREITVPGLTGVVTRNMGRVLAPLARARGYRSRYARYSGTDAP